MPTQSTPAAPLYFRDRHGIDVAYRRWPVAEPRGIVILSHGASEHSGRYERFASAVNDAGFSAWALDHRGHGGTAPSTGPGVMGAPGGQALAHDLDDLVGLAKTAQPLAPVAVFGHSMGSLIALAYATMYPHRLDALILCGLPAEPVSIGAIAHAMAALPQEARDQPGPSLTDYNTPFEPARTPFDWLSRDPDEVDRYLADPLCGEQLPLTNGFMADLLEFVGPAFTHQALAAISCPVHLIAGAKDPASGMGANTDALYDVLEAARVDVTSHHYPGARHELLNETNRDEVTADLLAWLQQHLVGAPDESRVS